MAEKINNWLMLKYGTEIALGAQIQPGLYIAHYGGIVISRYSIIGRNFTIRQNTTIGLSHGGTKAIAIGDNVDIGCHCCIISNGLIIGDNVTIGAMSFVNRNIPSNNLYYTKKENVISPRFIDSSDIK
ncbi:hypothetical protein SOASR030_33010 [Leminorella grimontii]|uniref:Serine acetyltransferase n=1 Tax=Leminorella grimontii TaxID=82981 RepID=A0AAV5N612_9GAMM|nr:hypothetical protein SOASR030_33010 [Leminorella grimontii]